ncbi:MAG: TolC family protein, partial [Deltaproteobacteria bacterium]
MNASESIPVRARFAAVAAVSALALASLPGVAWAQRPRTTPTPPSAQQSPPPPPASPAPADPQVESAGSPMPADAASTGARDVLEGGQVITLAQALDTARHHVPSVLSAIAQSRVAEGQLALARTPLMPSVTGSVTAAASGSNTNCISATCPTFTGTTPTSGMNGSMYADSTISARWMLWDFGRTSLNVEAARLSLQGAQAQVRAAERLAITAAATGYFVLLADEEAVASAAEILRQRERQLDIARRRVAAGVNPPIDQTRAEIAAQTSRLDLSSAEAAVLNDAAALSIAL